jgi:hypothetical protein
MKMFLTILLSLTITTSPFPARASMFGEENITLMKILMEAIKQYQALLAIVATGEDALGLMRDVNQGMHDSINLINTIAPNLDPGQYKDWESIQAALGKLSAIYGQAVPSLEYPVQSDTDREVAESITFNNSIYKYAADVDSIDAQIKSYNKNASPGRAQQLTAQTLGVMLNVMSQGLRAQATGLKLSAQHLALQNHKDKESTKFTLDQSDTLKNLMAEEQVDYATPQF